MRENKCGNCGNTGYLLDYGVAYIGSMRVLYAQAVCHCGWVGERHIRSEQEVAVTNGEANDYHRASPED